MQIVDILLFGLVSFALLSVGKQTYEWLFQPQLRLEKMKRAIEDGNHGSPDEIVRRMRIKMTAILLCGLFLATFMIVVYFFPELLSSHLLEPFM